MSDLQADRPSRIRPRDEGEEIHQPSCSALALSARGSQSVDESTAVPAAPTATRAATAGQPADVQPLPERMAQQSARSSRFSSPLDVLAKVELQLCLQFLDPESRLVAARCCRRLLQAADHPFVWRVPAVSLRSFKDSRLGSLIRQSLLRHARIGLDSGRLSAAEVAAVPHLYLLRVPRGSLLDPSLPSLPALQRLQILELRSGEPASTLQLLPAMAALRTLHARVSDDCADWGWLPAMPALSDLHLTCIFDDMPLSLIDAFGQCARLESLRLERPCFGPTAFLRLCAGMAMRQLRHLEIDRWDCEADECRIAFRLLVGLRSLRLAGARGIDLLLPQLSVAPALRTLSVVCWANRPDKTAHESSLPSRAALQQLLAAAPQLRVRLLTPTFASWRMSLLYFANHDAAETERMDEQWRELQHMGEEMERVTFVLYDE